MDARGMVRSARAVGTPRGVRALGAAWRRRRTDGAGLPPPGPERAREPGLARGAEPLPGGGVVHFARSSLRVRVAVGGAVFCGWDGAVPEPSYALAGPCPEPDPRASLEPDTEGGWRVVSERVLVTVSRHGEVAVGTPGGVVLRRDLPPRWWEPAAGGAGARWAQRSRVAADARFFGLGGRTAGPRLPDGTYRLWNTGPGRASPGGEPPPVTMPVLLVVADAGSHLVFHDDSWDGTVSLREGAEGAGSGHDRPGRCTVRMAGGPLRYWVVTGAPARVLHGWTALTGAPALPPPWALGYQHRCRGGRGRSDVREARAAAAAFRERGLPLTALHLDPERWRRGFPRRRGDGPGLPELAAGLRAEGVRLVSAVRPGVRPRPVGRVGRGRRDDAVHAAGVAEDAFVRDARGRTVTALTGPGPAVFPDFTDPRVRKWWGGLSAARLAQGFAGLWHLGDEPWTGAAPGDPTLPLSARHALEGRGGDHREAHNVYGLTMAEAAVQGVRELRPDERPFLVSRSGWAGMQRYGGAWAGDLPPGWAGLRAALAFVLGMGLCGVPYAGPDIPWWAPGRGGSPDAELARRWFQFGACLPFFRGCSGGRGGTGEPWASGAELPPYARAALERRAELSPYFATLTAVAARTGAPCVRPLWWQHPRDRALRDCGDAFLLGDALLVAPVLEPGARRRTVRLPRGRWYDTVSGERYEGPGPAELDAPLSRVPVLARAGAAVPVAGADGGTELEVWRPAPGRTGSGLVLAGPAYGGKPPEERRLTVRLRGGRVVVTGEDGAPAGFPVRVRG
ncbi:glycoside hydrolase family 31 protein [Streptomyces sp. JJ36]|uniref:glycoside hydrolase family 31 protein n=1 Tax=Streptomyces sp. JJ36 TaxID=2736645 RepID=UPI001F2D8AC5|nr:glycoside hydrolase family 31 protein [Streptomyces sp. JJ36]MCF6525416.1 glycosyl hydrolase [Streptomyces sp. JJ36]